MQDSFLSSSPHAALERGGGVFFRKDKATQSCACVHVCVHTCVRVHRTCANASAGTQKLRCGPRSRREEGEVIVKFRVCCWLVKL